MNEQYNWTISGLKNIGRINSRRNYWKCVLAALLISLSTGSAGSGGSSIVNQLSNHEAEGYGELFSNGSQMFFWNTLGLGMIAAALASISIVALIIGIFLLYPLEVGARRFFISNRITNAQMDEVGIAFNSNYLNIVKTQFLRYLFTYLWSLLFVVPGIIKSYEYRMIPYILAENPSIDWREAFRLSKAMMDGKKWNAFVLDLSFIGWHLLSAFTCGILDLFYTNPYQQQTNAELYDALKGKLFGTQRQFYGNGYGPNGGYSGNSSSYGPNGGYSGNSSSYGPNGGYSGNSSSYGPNGGYNGNSSSYGPNGGYSGNSSSYGPNGGYSGNSSSYGPNGGYNGNSNSYGPNGGYNTGSGNSSQQYGAGYAGAGNGSSQSQGNTGYSGTQPNGYNPNPSGKSADSDEQPKGYRPGDGTK